MIGSYIAHFHIVESLGVGGMGEVYRATDTELGRDVAIKVLPAAYTSNADRLARFEREAKVLASLNHPGVAAIYGIEKTNDGRALVMELVEGPTLAARIALGAIPPDEALEIAGQIADAMEYAHERGVVHRDLKPANVKLPPGGSAKVLDFGLAKCLADAAASPSDAVSSPTLTLPTASGVILGTAAYMSPEQARGYPVDRRADIWAFGVVLYEMLTGHQLFAGGTASDAMAAVLTRPVDWSVLPAGLPAGVQRFLRRCLEKDARRRPQCIGDFRVELEASEPNEAVSPVARQQWRRRTVAAVVAVACVAGLLGAVLGRAIGRTGRPRGTPLTFLSVPGATFHLKSSAAISPDGRTVAYTGFREAESPLYVRSLDRPQARALPASVGACQPFFSPDGRYVAFFSNRGLQQVALSGGVPRKVCDAGPPMDAAGAWLDDGSMVIGGGVLADALYPGLLRVPADGGAPSALTKLDVAAGEVVHRWPEVVPGASALVLVVERGDGNRVEVLDLATGGRKLIADQMSYARLADDGHLLLLYEPDSSSVLAVGFDPKTLTTTGTPKPVLADVASGGWDQGYFAVSRTGTLIYSPWSGAPTSRQVVWVDRDGTTGPLVPETGSWIEPRLSPNGRLLLLRKVETPSCSLWVRDLERGTMTRLTFEEDAHHAIWTPDGTQVTFASRRSNVSLVSHAVDGSGQSELLLEVSSEAGPGAWSPDGRLLAFTQRQAATGSDIWVVPRGKPELARPLLATKYEEAMPTFSPDGRLLAYTSDETGRDEVYLRPFPGQGPKLQVSNDGGLSPQFSPDGRQLYFVSGKRMMAVEVVRAPKLAVGVPRELFEGSFFWPRSAYEHYFDMSPDGRRFVTLLAPPSDLPELRVVLGWLESIESLED